MMALRDHIQHQPPKATPEGVVPAHYYILLDLRPALNPRGSKYGPDMTTSRGREYTYYSNYDVEREVLNRLARRYGDHTVARPARECATFALVDPISGARLARVKFDTEHSAFGASSEECDMLAIVCDVIDVLAAEAQNEPSFAEAFGMRYEEVPAEYKRLLDRVLRLHRMRKQLAEGSNAEVIVGFQKTLVAKAYHEVMELDDIEQTILGDE